MWAERVGPDEFRILNSPFFVFGVSAEEIVKARIRNHSWPKTQILRLRSPAETRSVGTSRPDRRYRYACPRWQSVPV